MTRYLLRAGSGALGAALGVAATVGLSRIANTYEPAQAATEIVGNNIATQTFRSVERSIEYDPLPLLAGLTATGLIMGVALPKNHYEAPKKKKPQRKTMPPTKKDDNTVPHMSYRAHNDGTPVEGRYDYVHDRIIE